MNLVEGQFGHNNQKPSLVKRWLYKQLIPRAEASVIFNWGKGVDNSNKVLKIKNQFQSYSCWGQHIAYILEILTGIEFSAKSLYARSFAIGGGVAIGRGQSELNTTGSNFEASVPSYKPDNTTDEQFMTDLSFLSKSTIDEAFLNAGYKSVDISIDMDSIAHAIEEYGAVGVELFGKNNGTWLSSNPQPPTPDNPNPSFNHYMAFVGAGQPLGYRRLKALQSWGNIVGDNGVQYFQENYLPFFFNVTAYYKPVMVIPPVVIPQVIPQPIEIPLQSTSTLTVTHQSSLWVSFWSMILKVIHILIGHP